MNLNTVVQIDVLRRKSSLEEPYHQIIEVEFTDINTTIAGALSAYNETTEDEIKWECSCLQKKCGACAMIINGRPMLACNAFIKDYKQGKIITLEPLRKFPVIKDLIVDRSILFENLKILGSFAEEENVISKKQTDIAYAASKCIQCGCCLEVCPNFYPGGEFFGAAGFIPATRLLTTLKAEDRDRIKKMYLEHEYKGCGKSLACENICPMEIETAKLLVNSNAAIFKRGK